MTLANGRGLVVARHRRELAIETPNGATLRSLVRGRRLKPLVGDEVRIAIASDGTVTVEAILPRTSVLERIDKRGRREGVAANVSLIAVVIAPEPQPDWQLVDRFLVAAELQGIDAAVICNKSDIADDGLDRRADLYRSLGYALVTTSAKTGVGRSRLAKLLSGHRCVLTGQSGAGKSSLINAQLASDVQATQELSERRAIGRHTTTAARLFRLPAGGELIDSPGVRRYAPGISDAAELADGFVEFRPFIARCRFNDCRHVAEPDCAVRDALSAGDIRMERYSSYRGLLESLERLVPNREKI